MIMPFSKQHFNNKQKQPPITQREYEEAKRFI